MQQLDHEEQQPIISEQYKHHQNVQNFKRYLVSSGCVMHLVKFLLGVRTKQKMDDSVPSDDVLKMFYDYIGAVQVDTKEQDSLKAEGQKIKQENEKLKVEIEEVKRQIEEKKAAKKKAEEQKRLRQEQELAKNTKKGGKK